MVELTHLPVILSERHPEKQGLKSPDFVEQSVTKTSTRELPTPFADIAVLNTVVTPVVSTNPFGCTTYEAGGVTMDAVAKTREYYNDRAIYQDDDAKTVGSLISNSSWEFTIGISGKSRTRRIMVRCATIGINVGGYRPSSPSVVPLI